MACEERLHQELSVIGNETFPLRLIDVPSTIASGGGVIFIVPSNWNFHVISHTWSLSIRELSKTVGKSIGLCPGDPQQYSDAFRGCSFYGDPGYGDLIRFLELLMSDGVSEVWFDALCINQDENAIEEKEREILHMGAYYKHSAGCYVVHHGLGQGFHLLGPADEMTGGPRLPRWFTRVWTLQEFLLPSKLTFVVGNLRQLSLSIVESCVLCNSTREQWLEAQSLVKGGVGEGDSNTRGQWLAVQNLAKAVLREFVAGGPAGQRFKALLEFLAVPAGTQELIAGPSGEIVAHPASVSGVIMKTMLCDCCHMPTITRKAKDQQLHFVDRKAYFAMVWLQYSPPMIPILGHRYVSCDQWQIFFRRLFDMLDCCYICASYHILDMIQSRLCSQEEDRVLSILPLLGLEGRMQALRTNQTLEDQVVKVAQALATVNPRLLLDLCIKDIISSPHMGYSWMPNLRPHLSWIIKSTDHAPLDIFGETTGLDHLMSASHGSVWRAQQARVHLKEVTTKGALRLEGNVVGARLVIGTRGSMEQHFNEADCYTCLRTEALDPRGLRHLIHQTQDCHLEVPQNLSIPLSANAFLIASLVQDRAQIKTKGCIIRMDPRLTWPPTRHVCPDCDEIHVGGLFLPIQCLHFMLSVDLILLLWAEAEGGQSIVMVCMGTTDLQLHKIGVLSLAPEVSNAIFSSNKQTSEYLLGGFEKDDVAKFWRNWGVIHGVQCNCFRTIILKSCRVFMGNKATWRKILGRFTKNPYHFYETSHVGPIEGMPSTSHPQPWPPNFHMLGTILRQNFHTQRIHVMSRAPDFRLVQVAIERPSQLNAYDTIMTAELQLLPKTS